MALFGHQRSAESREPDDTFPFFTAAQAGRFRDLARRSFAEAGREVTGYADHVVDDSGTQYGLANLAATCHNDERGERAWPQLTRTHIERILRAMAETPFDTMSSQQIYASTYLRLMPAGDLAPINVHYGREAAPGIVEVLNLDLPETVAVFSDDEVDRFGPLADLRRAGLTNLRAVQFDAHQTVEHEGGTLQVLAGESMFTASKMLVLPEVVNQYDPAPNDDLGVFVSAPFRHQLVFHVLRDASVIPSLQLMTGFARIGFDDSQGPLSPDVFWWHGGEFHRLTRHTAEGTVVDIGAELAAVLERLVDG